MALKLFDENGNEIISEVNPDKQIDFGINVPTLISLVKTISTSKYEATINYSNIITDKTLLILMDYEEIYPYDLSIFSSFLDNYNIVSINTKDSIYGTSGNSQKNQPDLKSIRYDIIESLKNEDLFTNENYVIGFGMGARGALSLQLNTFINLKKIACISGNYDYSYIDGSSLERNLGLKYYNNRLDLLDRDNLYKKINNITIPLYLGSGDNEFFYYQQTKRLYDALKNKENVVFNIKHGGHSIEQYQKHLNDIYLFFQ